ncbi:type II secretion system F family protein [Solwaraspora sp. WMMB335]|uniref:type II secretion system F family protein n=1 Tax=Solwaraspora sp. WMMB335 TaxID=3404118 RepID=UPI003B93EAD0
MRPGAGRRRRVLIGARQPVGSSGLAAVLPLLSTGHVALTRWSETMSRHPRLAPGGLLAGGGLLAWLAGGPVAALVTVAYAGLAARTVLLRRTTRDQVARRARQLDDLATLAADLRAGLPVHQPSRLRPAPGGLPPSPQPVPAGRADTRLAELAAAATRLAERTGAPLAELVERIESDARAVDRARDTAVAQAAGASATAWLLAGLPVGGIALGFAIGVDPLEVLLHTPIGAACALGAVTLQIAGLAWTRRLSRADVSPS